jgi:NCS1 family nucleobase:cation symporter-1
MAAAISPARPPASVEAPLTLDTAPPRPLGYRDQFALWANLGVSLLGFGGALFVLAPGGLPRLPVLGALAAAALGTVIGTLMLAVSTVPGAETGAPAMVLLRGLFGTRLSYLPTALNIAQCLGWGTFELVVISGGVEALTHGRGPHWAYVVVAGVVTTALTIRPIGAVRLLRRYVTVLVGIALVWFTVALVRQGVPPLTTGSWQGFFPGMDTALAVAVSWVPLAADYSRHSRTPRAGFWGSFTGYTLTQMWTYALGIVALAHVADNPDDVFTAFLAVPLGAAFFAVLVLREVDQSFTNVYSTAMSVQNLAPRVDRRVLSVAIGILTTLLALTVDFAKYQSFLYLIGSVFVPLFAVLAVDYFSGGRRRSSRWDLRAGSPARPLMLLPWALGFVVYQLLNPGYVAWWAGIWTSIGSAVHVTPHPWASASLVSFLVAALATALLRGRDPGARSGGRTG